MPKKTVVILGGNSFIGRHLCNYLCKEYHVISVVRPSNDIDQIYERNFAKEIEILPYDIFGSAVTLAFVKMLKSCDYMIMLAWQGTQGRERDLADIHNKSYRILLDLFRNTAKAFPRCSFIMMGSQAEYGALSCIVTEKRSCFPNTAYGKAKYQFYIEAMEFAKKNNLQFIELRLFAAYGIDDLPEKMLPTVVRKLAEGRKICMQTDCLQSYNLLWIDDLCVAVYKCLKAENMENGAYNLGSNDRYCLKDYLEIAKKIINEKSEIEFGRQKTLNDQFVYDNAKLKLAVHWEPQITFEKGVKEMLKNFR